MQLHPIDATLLAGNDSLAAVMASDYLRGDNASLLILGDYLEEEGEDVRMLAQVEVGKAYLFKTFGLFYLGKVAENDGRSIVLQNVTLVVAVGENMAAFTTGAMSYSEPFPQKARVILNSIHVYAAEEWTLKLPNS